MRRRLILIAIQTVALAGLAGPALAQDATVRLRGTIAAVDGQRLTVNTREGKTQVVTLSPDYSVAAIVPAKLEAIGPGTMVGVVGFGPADHQRAGVITIFPAGRPVREVQFAWDSAPDSTMTNAPVTAAVATTNGRTLTLSYKGQPVEVTVPPNCIIQTTEPGTPALLKPGAYVLIFATKGEGGALTAPRVNVGKDGFVPGY